MKQEKIKKLDKLRRNIIISEIILMIVFMIPIFIGGYINAKDPIGKQIVIFMEKI